MKNKSKYKIGDKVLVVEDTDFGVRINWEIIDSVMIRNDYTYYTFEGWDDDLPYYDVFSTLKEAIPTMVVGYDR